MAEFVWVEGESAGEWTYMDRSKVTDTSRIGEGPPSKFQSGGLFSRPRSDVLDKEEARSLEQALGVPVEHWSETKKVMKANDMAFVEKGDVQHRWRDEVRRWAESGSTPEQRGPRPDPRKKVPRKRHGPSMLDIYRERVTS